MSRFKIGDIDNEQFYQIPKILFTSAIYKDLSNDAKIIYAFLKDRMGLSRKKGWKDENGDIYLLFTQDHIAELLNVSTSTASRAMKQLKDHCLIDIVRQGLNKPNKIYIHRVDARQIKICTSASQTCSSDVSGPVTSANQDHAPVQSSNTEYNETDNSDTEYSDTENNNARSDRSALSQKRFEEFWDAYPRKVGKGAAEKAYSKIKPDDALQERILDAVDAAKQSFNWQAEGGRFIPNPATWLNQRRWEDELPAGYPARSKGTRSAYDIAVGAQKILEGSIW